MSPITSAKAHGIWLSLACGLFFSTALSAGHAQAPLTFPGVFAPSENYVPAPEHPLREDFCLDGRWQFQPVEIPASFKIGNGTPPELPQPDPQRWESTPIKIPSPWNVNTWGNGRDAGAGSKRPYVADSVYYPSYPAAWDRAQMGWLRRTFQVPGHWRDRRVLLHFEAVAGEARVFVNGNLAGTHFDSYLPFDFDITNLVKFNGDNEVLVGVRKSSLFNIISPDYPPGQQRTYPNGSATDNLVGIWNDVFLLALPKLRVDDVFIRPEVDKGMLLAEVTLRNDGAAAQSVTVAGSVSPWVNLAGKDLLSAPVPKWNLDAPVLSLPGQTVTVPPGSTARVTLQTSVSGQLKFWSPDSPNLNGLIVDLHANDGTTLDRKYTRFGWRQFQIKGPNLLLNGKPIQLWGDFQHPFGPYVMSRRFVASFYGMIKAMHGNAVRPHANVMPRLWTDLADEMGLCVLDEASIFGSSINLNLKAPITWDRFNAHIDGLVLRDRNHPSVFGWSTANEMFALFLKTNDADKAAGYSLLKKYALRPRALDSTRDWISVDGDGDLDGTLPVWSHHFGIGLPAELPATDKPLMIGEHGGTYFAGPPRILKDLGTSRAYESYAARNEPLAFDLYRMITQCAKPRLAFFSPSELVWFGLEQLPFGYSATSRPPDKTDGIFFPGFRENQPGVQIERLPPYVMTINPGFDPSLPAYKPMAMFEAMKAALDPRGPQPSPWATLPPATPHPPSIPARHVNLVGFLGDQAAATYRSLSSLGLPLATGTSAAATSLLVIDGESLPTDDAALAAAAAKAVWSKGGLVWVMLRDHGAALSRLADLIPPGISLTDRHATSLVQGVLDASSAATAGFNAADLYFLTESGDCQIQKAGLAGSPIESGRVLLKASNTDWSLFERQPEIAKCSSMLIDAHLQKSSGAALVELPRSQGTLWLSTLDPTLSTPPSITFWRQLWSNLGVQFNSPARIDAGGRTGPPGQRKAEHDLLLDGPKL